MITFILSLLAIITINSRRKRRTPFMPMAVSTGVGSCEGINDPWLAYDTPTFKRLDLPVKKKLDKIFNPLASECSRKGAADETVSVGSKSKVVGMVTKGCQTTSTDLILPEKVKF